MKETRKIAELANATAVDFGKLNEINEYVLELGPEIKIPGGYEGDYPSYPSGWSKGT